MENLQQQIDDLKAVVDSLKSSTTISKEMDAALRKRLGASSGGSEVTVASKTQAVNEAGAGAYNVAKPMTAIVKVTIAGKIYNLADYS